MSNDPYENSVARTGMVNRIVAGRYEVLESLGEGPLLAAYRARDRSLNRIVTLKTVLPAYASSQEVVDSLKEGLSQTLSLTHHNIARTYDVGVDEETGIVYLAEEFVRGIDLKERIRRAAPFQLSAATETAIAVAEGLEMAHARGIAHGDVRPGNILIGPEGQIKLTNLGVAAAQNRIVASDPALLLRVVGYVAPDAGRTAAPTPSADLYALGVILFEMLTGEMPYSGDNAVQVALKHAQEPIPSPRQVNAGVPVALDGIVRKALGKTPETRYASADRMLRDLRAVRDALRYGKSLSWSPLDSEERAPASAPAATRPANVATTADETLVMPSSGRRGGGATFSTAAVAPP
jgi:serine/threonine-protein kinase